MGPRFDWGSDGVGFEELGFGLDIGEMVVGRVGGEGIDSRAAGGVIACGTNEMTDIPSLDHLT